MVDTRARRFGRLLAPLRFVAVAFLALLAQVCWVAGPAQAKDAPNVTHPVRGCQDCLSCHQQTGVRSAPKNHVDYKVDECLDCHEPKEGLAQPKDVASLTVLSGECRTCHNQQRFSIVSELGDRTDVAKRVEIERGYAHRFIACVTCHEKEPHKVIKPVTRQSVAEACGRCHVEQLQAHQQSVHGKSLAAGKGDAASCVDCHSKRGSPHSISRVLNPDSPAYHSSVAGTCAKCHAKPELMKQYNVETVVYQTYLSNFHGKANVLSPFEITQHPAATCVSCHGYHDILAADDPHSTVNAKNLPKTCAGCHPGAGEQFAASWMGHKEASPTQFPLVYFTERFFFFLTSTVLTCGFFFMVLLDVIWRFRRRRRPAVATDASH